MEKPFKVSLKSEVEKVEIDAYRESNISSRVIASRIARSRLSKIIFKIYKSTVKR